MKHAGEMEKRLEQALMMPFFCLFFFFLFLHYYCVTDGSMRLVLCVLLFIVAVFGPHRFCSGFELFFWGVFTV